MADYDVNIWGRWQASDHPEFYNFLRSILRPKFLLYFDGGKPEGVGTRQAAFLDMLRNDILNSDLSSSGILASVAKPAPGMNFAETVSMLDSFRMKDVTAFSRSELIGDDLMSSARTYLDDKYVAYLDGAGTMGLSDSERDKLDNFIANPFDARNVLALSGMGDKTESRTVQSGQWNLFTSKWDSTLGAQQGVLITPNAATAAPTTTATPAATTPPATTLAPGERRMSRDSFRNFLTPSELEKLKPVLSEVAYNYLTTGEYPAVATFGEDFLNAAQRQVLKEYARNPEAGGTQIGQFFNPILNAPRNVQENRVNNVVEDIANNRTEMAEESARTAPKPTASKKPNVPLPPGQVYSWDSNKKLWKVVGSPGSGKPQQLIRYVNQYGETVDEDGNRIQDGPAAGFGPERGTGAISRPATPATTTPATTTPATAPAATTAPVQRTPSTLGQDQGIDEAALAAAEFDVGGAASGRTSTPAWRTATAAPAATTDSSGGPTPEQAYAGIVQPGMQTRPSGGGVVGTGGGVIVGGGVADAAAEDTSVPVDWEQAAAEMYPEYYAIVKSVPEVAALLKKSLGPPAWSDEKLEAELRKTNWWKTTVASAREWDMASGLDPATYQGRVDEQAAAINQQALDLGVRLSDERLQKLATDSLRLGWSSQTITNSIGMAATEGGTAGTTQLREGYYGQSIREISRQYGVSLADQTFNQFVDKIAVGEETLGSFQDYALSIAKSLYPSLTEQFDAGRTFNQATDNYKQIAASILERDPNSINMTDPTWVQAVTYQPDPKTGEQRMMNMAEWGDYLRKNEALGYQYTTEARSRAYEVADKLANMFGRV